jgi:hypothetical protein
MAQERPMFISKKHVSRRAVLKGAGVSIALPLLDAMIRQARRWRRPRHSRRRASDSSTFRTAP